MVDTPFPSIHTYMFFLLFFISSAGNAVGATINKLGDLFIGTTAASQPSNAGVTLAITVFAGLVIAAAMYSTSRGHLKSPWSRRRRKQVLTPQLWKSLFTPEGKFGDGGLKFLKKVRSGGVEASIRSEVWPFLLGVYELNSCKEERDKLRTLRRKKYEKLRKQCRKLLRCSSNGDSESEDVVSATESLSSEEINSPNHVDSLLDENALGSKRFIDPNMSECESSDSDSSQDTQLSQTFPSSNSKEENEESIRKSEAQSKRRSSEDFSTWQRIIRLDAVRANGDWIPYSTTQAQVSEEQARRSAEAVRLKDYKHLEPSRIFHASRLVAILEAYALHDPEIGYCQGMSDLLSPIISVITKDHEAFWCFVGFMRKARHNFRLDEIGIRRQLNRVSKIIQSKDSYLYKHLEKMQAEDCFFVYRMVVVLFRRELTFEQTICLWEVMWADQAAIRAGIGKSAWSRIRLQAPPTEDLLLYAIAASVLQRRKRIIEKYCSMDEIIRECNSMAGQLDVWKLLDDAHDLVVSVHDKIETT